MIYCRHDRGFALHSMRTPETSRLYLQVPADEDISRWPDERIWGELSLRLGVPGWELRTGPILDKSITGVRSFITEPMRHQRLFLAGDAAHIVPPTGAKGLNLAVADVAVLATALISLLRHGRSDLADAYSAICTERAWRATYLSWWMTTMLHVLPRQDPFDSALQIAQLQNLAVFKGRRQHAGGDLRRPRLPPLRPVRARIRQCTSRRNRTGGREVGAAQLLTWGGTCIASHELRHLTTYSPREVPQALR